MTPMRLAHGLYNSRRRKQIRAIWNGRPFARGNIRDVVLREGAFRHYIGTLLVSFGVPVSQAADFACSRIHCLQQHPSQLQQQMIGRTVRMKK